MNEPSPANQLEQRSSIEQAAIRRSRIKTLFSEEDMDFEERQNIMETVTMTDFQVFRRDFKSYWDLFKGRKLAGYEVKDVYGLIERLFEIKQIPAGKFRSSTGYVRFVLARDEHKAQEALDPVRMASVRIAVERNTTNPSETPGPTS